MRIREVEKHDIIVSAKMVNMFLRYLWREDILFLEGNIDKQKCQSGHVYRVIKAV